MRSLLRILVIVTIMLALPLVTMPLWEDRLLEQFAAWRELPPAAGWLAAALLLLLASDILLPVPSGPLITIAGGQLGIAVTALVAWLGLMLGGLVGFALAKSWGRPLAERLSSPHDLANLHATVERYDVWLLLVTRPLPILAEATILLAGALDVRWSRLMLPLAIGNGVVAVSFAVLGQQAQEQEWMIVALCLSIVVPLAGAWMLQRRLANCP